MKMNNAKKLFFALFWATISCHAYADAVTNPCTGIFSIVDRPSKADSACAMPYGEADIEGGYQFLNLSSSGTAQNFPNVAFRLGLPANNEFVVVLPNYNTQTIYPRAGFGATVVGIKHEIGYTSNWITAIEGLVTLPSGSNAFGSNSVGGILNAIGTYSFTSSVSATAMLGVSSQTAPTLANGQRYSSINPDILVSWQFNDKAETFAEVYGQSRTAPGQTAGYDADAGILYQIAHNTEADVEIGQRLSGKLGGFNNYVGAGIATLFNV